MKSKRALVLSCASIALVTSAAASPVRAANGIWNGSLSSFWTNGSNWFGFSEPGTGDLALFASVDPGVLRANVLLDADRTVGRMTVHDDSLLAGPYLFSKINNALLTVTGIVNFGNAGSGDASMTFDGFRMNVGEIRSIEGSVVSLINGATVTSAGIVELQDSSQLKVTSGTLNAADTIALNGSSRLQIDAGGTLNMNAGTSLNLNSASTRLDLNRGFAFGAVTVNTSNGGVTPGADIVGTSYIDIGNGVATTVNLIGTGTTLTAAGTTVSDWGLNSSGSATVNVTNTATANVQNLNIGTANAVAAVNVNTGSSLTVGGTLTMGGGGAIRSVSMTLDNGTLDVAGVATLNFQSDINLTSGGTVRFRSSSSVNSGARIDWTGGTLNTSGVTLTLNGGTLARPVAGGAALSANSTLAITGGGTATFNDYFDIGSGLTAALNVTGTGSTYSSGSLSDWGRGASGNATVNLTTGAQATLSDVRIGTNDGAAVVSVLSGSTLTANSLEMGGGSTARTVGLSINAGTVQLNRTSGVAALFNEKAVLTLSSGTFNSQGDVTFSFGSTANWSGGAFQIAPGKTLTLNGGVFNRTIAFAGGIGPDTTLAISNAGRFESTGSYTVGDIGIGASTVTIAGASSRLRTQGSLTLGGTLSGQAGHLTTTAGGTVIVGDNATGFAADRLVVGDSGALGSNQGGVLILQNGSTLNHHSRMLVGPFDNTSGEVFITDPGSQLTVGQDLFIGNAALSNVRVTVQDGGKLKVVNEFNFFSNTAKLVVNAGGTFEANATMLSRTRDNLALGYNGGNWLGTRGITSESVQSDARLAVGYVVGAGLLTARVALKGDATLDGVVNFNDLLALAQNYNGTGKFWAEGDNNYDGTVNFPDLLALAQNYNQTYTGSLAGDWALARSVVPEPTTAVASIALGAGAMRPRRRSRR